MPARSLDGLALNRALLARQMLLDRVRAPLPTVVERMGGIQAQYAPSSYVGLWSRTSGFERADLDAALEAKRVVQATLMRSTIHLVSRRDYHWVAAGIRRFRREWWLKASKLTDEREVRRAADHVRELLADGPRSRAELVRALGVDAHLWNGIGLWLDLVRVPPSGTWTRRRADLFATAEQWLGPACDVTEQEGLRLLLRRYMAAFGPASRRDVESWAGVSRGSFDAVIERVRLRRFRQAGGGELLDLPGRSLPPDDTPAPVRLLPTWDAVLLVHARRTGVLPERFRSRVFNSHTPHSFSTFLVDGRVAGTWRYEAGRMFVDAFEPLPGRARSELDEELDAALELHR
jgi:hypothetical protein